MTKYIYLLLIIFMTMSCNENKILINNDNNLKNNLYSDSCILNDFSYENVIKYHKNNCLNNIRPLIIKVNLNSDTINEVALKISDYSRGSFYILYSKGEYSWDIISDEVNINHFGIQVDSNTNSKWYNFSTFESHKEFIWKWKNGKYKNTNYTQ